MHAGNTENHLNPARSQTFNQTLTNRFHAASPCFSAA
jgi:hypothetical protein